MTLVTVLALRATLLEAGIVGGADISRLVPAGATIGGREDNISWRGAIVAPQTEIAVASTGRPQIVYAVRIAQWFGGRIPVRVVTVAAFYGGEVCRLVIVIYVVARGTDKLGLDVRSRRTVMAGIAETLFLDGFVRAG